MFTSEDEITPRELHQLIQQSEKIRLIDCRELNEFEFVELPQSELIPLSLFPQIYSNSLKKFDEQIVIYCHHGVRSLQALYFLKDQGFSNTKSLAGGIDLWSLQVDSSVARY